MEIVVEARTASKMKTLSMVMAAVREEASIGRGIVTMKTCPWISSSQLPQRGRWVGAPIVQRVAVVSGRYPRKMHT